MSTPVVSATVTGLLLAQASSPQPGLRFENRRWSWQEHVSECARYAAALRARRQPGRPFHVGVLADNVPEFSFLLGGCAFAALRDVDQRAFELEIASLNAIATLEGLVNDRLTPADARPLDAAFDIAGGVER